MSANGITRDTEILAEPLRLPCGTTLPNRLLKSAMSEALGSPANAPTARLSRLYETWANGGTGTLVTGNVMVDRRHLGEPGNVAIEDETQLHALRDWAQSGTKNGVQLWMQLNHPGKQTPVFVDRTPVAPSAVPLAIKGFVTPRALLEHEIEEIVARFARAAAVARKTGFTGVQIHGAHGYLVSQFLSPRHNQRTDAWGGTPERRMRFVLAVYEAIREVVGPAFPVSIKLNSADFQKGGFSEEESLEVVKTLARAGIDLIEISGGSYESPRMMGSPSSDKSSQREAYFLQFAAKARQVCQVPLAVTGGFRSAAGMAEALRSGATDMIGLARPLAVEPELSGQILRGERAQISLPEHIGTGINLLDKAVALNLTWYTNQLRLIADGKRPDPELSGWHSIWLSLTRTQWQSLRRVRV
jgi:2,4-dienoyl-CoA reductase-like NADH-dependent reductase (Old Yellow Enzyme family)